MVVRLYNPLVINSLWVREDLITLGYAIPIPKSRRVSPVLSIESW
jgi:hypothetical protein